MKFVALLTLLFTYFPCSLQAQSPLDSLGCFYLEELFSKVQDPYQVTSLFYRSLESLRFPSSQNEARLERLKKDVIDIMTEQEHKQYATLQSVSEKVIFFRDFWLKRDLTPATEVNERLLEHYNRLLYARDKFCSLDWRGYDDRGRIYIKYGPPDDAVEDRLPPISDPMITWVYYKFGYAVTFNFIYKGYAFKLTSRLDDGIKSDDPKEVIKVLFERLRDRAYLSPEYARAFFDVQSIYFGSSGVSVGNFLNEFQTKTSVEVAKLPSSATDIFNDIQDLPFHVFLARFNDSTSLHTLLVVYGIKKSDIKNWNEEEETELVIHTALRDYQRLIISSQVDTLKGINFKNSEFIIGVKNYSVASGRYFVALDIEHLKAEQRGLQDFKVTTGNFISNSLRLSSVIFVTEIVNLSEVTDPKNYFFHKDLAIKPYPFNELNRQTPIYIYFEIYGLSLDATGKSLYRVEYQIKQKSKKSFFAKLNPFAKKRKRVTISEDLTGKSQQENVYLKLDFSRLRPGSYELTIKVKDKLRNLNRERKITFDLF